MTKEVACPSGEILFSGHTTRPVSDWNYPVTCAHIVLTSSLGIHLLFSFLLAQMEHRESLLNDLLLAHLWFCGILPYPDLPGVVVVETSEDVNGGSIEAHLIEFSQLFSPGHGLLQCVVRCYILALWLLVL